MIKSEWYWNVKFLEIDENSECLDRIMDKENVN